jgi:hypothetical protein
MKITKAFRQFLVASFFIAIVAVTASSCKASQYGCPNKITQEEPQKEVNV